MVSFWPFKGDNSSAASFEKALSQLSSKINKASAQNDRFRQNQRRYKALWTLYSSFAYILVALILTLVTGWDKWGAVEYSAMAGGPVLIYCLRTALDAYYNYRLSHSQKHLNQLTTQRETTIEKLKSATKYNSTQQLLDKYGGSPHNSQSSPTATAKQKSDGGQNKQSTPRDSRTGFAPPPTANIPSRQPPQVPLIPEGAPGAAPPAAALHLSTGPTPMSQQPQNEPSEEFAPNAFSATTAVPSMSSQYAVEGPKWYDRILDIVLGEDETSAKNRIALICQKCRLINGQAPPGARTLEDVGKWRCSACHAWNGVESEEKEILKRMSGEQAASVSSPGAMSPVSAGADSRPFAGGLENQEGDYEHVDEEVADD